jgi:ABC-2 type transport system permease protein
MGNFFTLVSIENMKLWKRLSTKVMLIIMVVIILVATGIIKYMNVSSKTSKTTTVSESWKEDLQKGLTAKKTDLAVLEKGTEKMSKVGIGSMKKSIAEDEYSINNNIKPESKQNIWTRLATNAPYGQLIALFLIITCAAMVAGEFSEGTMKMMITRPYSRSEILTAKLMATLLYGVVLLLTSFLLNFILLGICYGFNGMGAKEMLWTGSKILYVPALLKTLAIFGLDFLTSIAYVLVAFVISAMFRSRSIATGFSLFLLLAGSGITVTLAMFFSWGKYLPFALWDFSSFVKIGSSIQGTSLGFALILAVIYSTIFCFAGYFVFEKRDI